MKYKLYITKRITIKILAHRSLILDTQHPDGLEKIRELEAQGRPTRLEIEEPPVFPPRFVTELRVSTCIKLSCTLSKKKLKIMYIYKEKFFISNYLS